MLLKKRLQQRINYEQGHELCKYNLNTVLLKVVKEETTTMNQLKTSYRNTNITQ